MERENRLSSGDAYSDSGALNQLKSRLFSQLLIQKSDEESCIVLTCKTGHVVSFFLLCLIPSTVTAEQDCLVKEFCQVKEKIS